MSAKTIPVKAVPIGNGIIEGYRLVPKGVAKVTMDELIRLAARNGKTAESIVRFHADNMLKTIIQQVLENKRVDAGYATYYLYPTGSLENANDALDVKKNPIKLVAQVPASVQSLFDDVTAENESQTVELWLFEIVEDGHTENSQLFTANANVVINTTHGKIDTEAEDEGVWLLNAAGEIVSRASVVSTNSGYSVVKFASLPAPGEYTLVYSCRDGEDADEYTVARRTRKVTVNAAA